MKHLNRLLSACFVLFAALQLNDPDPWLWIPIYLYAAGLCLFSAMGGVFPKALFAGIIYCCLHASWLFISQDGVISWAKEHHGENLVQTMKAAKPWIENTREFGGLMIVLLAFGLNLIVIRRKRSAH
jgi:hypothetical protein